MGSGLPVHHNRHLLCSFPKGSCARTTSTISTGLGSPQQLRDSPKQEGTEPMAAPAGTAKALCHHPSCEQQELILRMSHHSSLFKVSSSEVLCSAGLAHNNSSYNGGTHSYLIYNVNRSLIIMMLLKINIWLDKYTPPPSSPARTLPVSKPITAQYTHRLSST